VNALTNSRFFYSSYVIHAIAVVVRIARRAFWFLQRKPIQIGKFSYDPRKVVMMTNTYRPTIVARAPGLTLTLVVKLAIESETHQQGGNRDREHFSRIYNVPLFIGREVA